MEKGTVTIPVEKFEYLRNLEKSILENTVYTVSRTGRYGYSISTCFYTKDEVISEIARQNKEQEDEILRLEEKISLEKNRSEQNEKELQCLIKRMSIWDFIKWRKS